MKLSKDFLMNGDTYRRICGKVSNFKLRRTVGFTAEDVVDIDEVTYLFGFKIKETRLYNIKVTNPVLLQEIKKYTINDDTPDRVIVKGFK